MRDLLFANGRHELQLRFHFAPRPNLQIESLSEPGNTANCDQQGVDASGELAGLQVFAFGPQGHWGREEGSVSHCYGQREAAPVCTFSARTAGDRMANENGQDELITLLLPNSGRTSSKFEVREVEAIGGRAFEITGDEYSDLVMLGDPRSRRVETVRMVSDFNWSWARFSKARSESRDETGELLELLVMDGQRLELDGKEILKSAKRVDYLMACRSGDRFRVETSDGLLDLSFPIQDLEQLFAEASLPEGRSQISDLKSEI